MTLPTAPTLTARLWMLGERAIDALDWLKPVAQLAARLYVAAVFFRSGLTKLHDWGTTLALFSDEYQVPLLNPTVAAFLATGGELGLSVLLVAGLFGRFAAAGLSVINIIALISLMDVPDAALMGHVFWASLLGFLVLWGPGALSLDRWLVSRLRTWALGGKAATPAAAHRISRVA
ncbi:MAG: DoxX family protein [Burkholderiales bacterium]